jgi:UDPglucose--hexose-1-phosphate uridylyltransferase
VSGDDRQVSVKKATIVRPPERLEATICHPGHGFEPVALQLEIRQDPLTGHTARILPDAKLLPRSQFDLEQLAEATRSTCPFCSERIEKVTPRFPRALLPEGRLRCGEAVLFPNLLPYSKYSSVSVYSPDRHFLPLAQLTPRLFADNLAAQVAFARTVRAHDPTAAWISVNANHMLPSGSSVFHPHLQGSANPVPTTMQRLLAETPPERFRTYVDEERESSERWVADTGNVAWLAAYAPVGPAELRAFVFGATSPDGLERAIVDELAAGIASALGVYAELGFESFNLALYGAPPAADGYPLNLRLICRSNLTELYRSDATWLERLHWEAAIDVAPEALASRARERFARRPS